MRIVRTLSSAAATLAIAGTLIVVGRAEQSSDTPQFSQALADMNVALAHRHRADSHRQQPLAPD